MSIHKGKEAKQLEPVRTLKHVVSLFITACIVKAWKLYIHTKSTLHLPSDILICFLKRTGADKDLKQRPN